MSLQTRLAPFISAVGADIKQLQAQIAALPGGGAPVIADKFVTTQQTTTSTTGVAVAGLSDTVLAPGRYAIKAWFVWTSSATTVGAGFRLVTTGGTVPRNLGHIYTQTTGGAAATGIADQQSVAGTAQLVESRAWRGGADPGPFTGVDTAGAEQLSILEAVLVVTAQTTLDIFVKAEAAGTISVEEGSLLEFKAIG